MATTKLYQEVPTSQRKSSGFSTGRTSEVLEISQLEIELLLSLKQRLADAQATFDAASGDMRARLEAGYFVQAGPRSATLVTTVKRYPSWKGVAQMLARLLGHEPDEFCSTVMANTPPTKSVPLVVR